MVHGGLTAELLVRYPGCRRLPHTSTPGTGSRGAPAAVGHWVALGNTEEKLVVQNLGVAERGLRGDGHFDHATGVGRVEAQKGRYADALRKGNKVFLLVTETLGGVNNTSLRFLTRLAHRAGADSDLEYPFTSARASMLSCD